MQRNEDKVDREDPLHQEHNINGEPLEISALEPTKWKQSIYKIIAHHLSGHNKHILQLPETLSLSLRTAPLFSIVWLYKNHPELAHVLNHSLNSLKQKLLANDQIPQKYENMPRVIDTIQEIPPIDPCLQQEMTFDFILVLQDSNSLIRSDRRSIDNLFTAYLRWEARIQREPQHRG